MRGLIYLIYTVRRIVLAIRRISGWLEERRIRVYASQSAFFIIISSVPMLMLILSVAGALIPCDEELYSTISDRLPSAVAPMAEKVLDEIGESSDPSLISLSALTLLWSASRGVRGIGGGVRSVYGGKKDKYYTVYLLKSLLMTVMYVFSVILALTVWVFGDMILERAGQGSPIGFLKLINNGALFMLLSAVFMLTYRFFGGRRDLKEAPGAFTAAAGWFIYSAFFEYYVENIARYSYVYGSLAALIVVMLWLYSCMEILLVGAVVNLLLTGRCRDRRSLNEQLF